MGAFTYALVTSSEGYTTNYQSLSSTSRWFASCEVAQKLACEVLLLKRYTLIDFRSLEGILNRFSVFIISQDAEHRRDGC